MRPSMGSVGDAYDNAMCELFFATLECELLDRELLRNQAEAKMKTFDFIEGWYNPHRRHSALGYKSPTELERDRARVAAPLWSCPRSDGQGIPGLSYITFGMDDPKTLPGGRKERIQRFYLPPRHKWWVRLTARESILPPVGGKGESLTMPAEQALDQARAALWLLCHFGGVGSKSRKGFGSLT